jgi:hypothetical protein
MLWKIFIAVLSLSVAAQFFVEGHPHFAPERLFAWNALYGFLACAALIVGAKALGLLIKRDERYYDDR